MSGAAQRAAEEAEDREDAAAAGTRVSDTATQGPEEVSPAPVMSEQEAAVVAAFEAATNPLLDDLIHPLKDRGLIYQAGIAWEGYDEHDEDRRDTDDLLAAQVVTSRVRGTDLHMPLLDVDLGVNADTIRRVLAVAGVFAEESEMHLVPSSTAGHHHVYIDRQLAWPRLALILGTFVGAGLVEDGYASASVARGYTALRLPWVPKYAPWEPEHVDHFTFEAERLRRLDEGVDDAVDLLDIF